MLEIPRSCCCGTYKAIRPTGTVAVQHRQCEMSNTAPYSSVASHTAVRLFCQSDVSRRRAVPLTAAALPFQVHPCKWVQTAKTPGHSIGIVSQRNLGSTQLQAASIAQTGASVMTCRRCKQQFTAADNTSSSCRYHPSLFSGGEVAKAIGFVRASDAPEDQLERVVGRKGLLRFWDCCGSEDEAAPGCCVGFHVTYDHDLNE